MGENGVRNGVVWKAIYREGVVAQSVSTLNAVKDQEFMCGAKTKTSDKRVMCGANHRPNDSDAVWIHKESELYNPEIYDSS